MDRTKALQKQCRKAAEVAAPGGPAPAPALLAPGAEEEAGSGEGSPSCQPLRRRDCLGGPGGAVLGPGGQVLGLAVAEERRGWRLADGRVVRKSAEGKKWRWAAKDTEDPSGNMAADSETTLPSQSTGPSPVSSQDSRASPSPAASPLLLPEPSLPLQAAALSGEDKPEFFELEPDEWPEDAQPLAAAGRAPGAAARSERHPDTAILGTCDWLPLQAALCAKASCRDWARALQGRLPLALPPPQADALLRFCLLEVLVCFDDDRLPLPMSAVYSEMRTAARRAVADRAVRAHLEESVLRPLGTACKAQQEEFLRQRRPHHTAWSAELKGSGFKTLKRLGEHFAGERLVEVFRQRWRKRIHHSPNIRTCQEWLLTKVNRQHPSFVEHALWRHHLLPSLTIRDAVC